MRKIILMVVALAMTITSNAQFIKEKSLNAQIGYGITSPYESADEIASGGFFAQGEYVLGVASWVELRPYFGFVTTSSDGEDLNGNPTFEKAETTAVLFGGKVRLRAPIPWVAPYIEIGLGASIGRFETRTAFSNYDKNGIVHHIPFSLGLELGKNHGVDLGLTYFFQPSVEQVAGAVAVGISIPINN